MKYVCACLNVRVEFEGNSSEVLLENYKSGEEVSHSYFDKSVYNFGVHSSSISEKHPTLLKTDIVGCWNIRKCLVCQLYTHATNFITGVTTCSSLLYDEPPHPELFAEENSLFYSAAFHLLLPLNLKNNSKNLLLENLESVLIISNQGALQSLSKQAIYYIENAKKNTAEKIRQYKEEQKKELEQVLSDIQRDRLILLELLRRDKEEEDLTPTPSPSWMACLDTETSNIANKYDALPNDQNLLVSCGLPAQFDTNIIEDEMLRLQIEAIPPIANQVPLSSDSLGVFEMDDFDTANSGHLPPNNSEDQSDEEYEIVRERVPMREFARSAPLDVPCWPERQHILDDSDDEPTNLSEIAVSMRRMSAAHTRMSSAEMIVDRPSRRVPSNYQH